MSHRSPLTTSPITELPKSDHFETEENIKEKKPTKNKFIYPSIIGKYHVATYRYSVLYDVWMCVQQY